MAQDALQVSDIIYVELRGSGRQATSRCMVGATDEMWRTLIFGILHIGSRNDHSIQPP